jgi:DNA polymerase IV
MESKLIFHIDMNSFFASCEEVRNPSLKNCPIAVVGDASRRSGIVLAASYEAKAYGIKTTMPINQALSLLPSLTLVTSSFGLYTQMSKQVMSLFDMYTPTKEQVSIDEAFLDMTGTEMLFGAPIDAAKKIMHHIQHELELGCSIGISTNRLLAKMASDMKKPLGITTLFPNEIQTKMWPMKVGELYGIGKKTVPKLYELGIKTIGELANSNVNMLITHFGEKSGNYMHEASNGIGSDAFNEEGSVALKSVGNELTYSNDLTTLDAIRQELLILSDLVGYRLRHKLLKGRTLQIKIKFNDFEVITRSVSFSTATDSTDFIFQQALHLVDENRGTKPIRLLGISLTNFDGNVTRQLSLFEDTTQKDTTHIDKMVDCVREKFGYNAIARASILEKNQRKAD